MKTITETVMTAMDCSDQELLPYLPYILQDFWEIGSCPDTMIALIEKHSGGRKNLKVLDLGCGKGAVSVKIAARCGYKCYGIDAILQFIEFAREKAEEYNVAQLCTFSVGDIREEVKTHTGYDIIVLGAIGQVFGNYRETLVAISGSLNDDGFILIDDGYTETGADFTAPQVLCRHEVHNQIREAKMKLVEEVVFGEYSNATGNYDTEYKLLEQRCSELMGIYPDKADMFKKYAAHQKTEYEILKSKVICSTMVVSKSTG